MGCAPTAPQPIFEMRYVLSSSFWNNNCTSSVALETELNWKNLPNHGLNNQKEFIDQAYIPKNPVTDPTKIIQIYTVNKGLAISRPQPGCHLPNTPWPEIIYSIPVPGRFGQK